MHIHRGLAKASTMDWLLGGQPLLHTLETMPPTHLMRRAVDWALSNDIPGLGGGDLQVTRVTAESGRARGDSVYVAVDE